MLNIVLKPHRANLKANTADEQKLFVMLKLIPEAAVAQTRPPLAYALVVDTSGSMAGKKLDQAIQAAHGLIDDARLAPEDQLAVIHFDDNANTLLPLSPLAQKPAARQAVESMRRYSGGTKMAKGMRLALQELQSVPSHIAKRVFLLTDGQTFDEPDCRKLAVQFAESNTPIIAIGIGDEYNEELLMELAQTTQGRPYHYPHNQLQEILNVEVGASVREVVTDLQATVASVKGVQLQSLTRVYPSLAEVSLEQRPYRLGNIAAGDHTVFVLEFTISGIARPPSRVRIAQVGLAGYAPALNRRDEFPVADLFVNFTPDESAVAEVDPEVLSYVQQKNIDRMVQEAARLATVDAARARQTLQVAASMTQQLGNVAMTQMLQNALGELNQQGAISADTVKTLRVGGRTQTVKVGGASPTPGLPSDEEIRRLTDA